MNTRQRIATVTAAFAIAWGGAAMTAPMASAQPLECTYDYQTGSAGHHGAAIRCHGAPFNGLIECTIRDNGFVYRVMGHRVEDGDVATVWCGLGADVTFAGGIAYVTT